MWGEDQVIFLSFTFYYAFRLMLSQDFSPRFRLHNGKTQGDVDGPITERTWSNRQRRISFSEGHTKCSKCCPSNLPLRMTRRTFQRISCGFHLPDSYLQMARQSCTVFVDSLEEPHGSVLSTQIQSVKVV